MPLTHKQEHFAQLVAAGATQSDAYRQAYDVSPDTHGTTIWDQAATLARHSLIAPRIQELKAAAQAAALAEIAWDSARLVREADRHRELALSGGWRGVGSANGALEIIGKATGILSDKPQNSPPVQITRVVVVLSDGKQTEARELSPHIVEAGNDEKGLDHTALDEGESLLDEEE